MYHLLSTDESQKQYKLQANADGAYCRLILNTDFENSGKTMLKNEGIVFLSQLKAEV